MADYRHDDLGGGVDARAGRTTRLISMAGAATSVALVLGMGYWGYRLAVRDMTGIPVVRALEGPMRIAPDDPGGQIADHLGLSVNVVAAEGGVSVPADQLVLAPAPIGLSDDDLTGTNLAAAVPVAARAGGLAGLSDKPMPDEEEANFDPLQADGNVDIAALADTLAGDAVPLSGDLDITLKSSPVVDYALPQGMMAQSPRPRARPGTDMVVAAVRPETPEITGKGLASGTRLVQLGAFDSEDIARSEWDRLSGKFADLMGDKTRIVQAAQSGGRMFYRLRAMGFSDEADSRRFCSALVAERAACIPVAVR
jgi:hypothetical protein